MANSAVYKPAPDGRQHVTLRNMDRELWRQIRREALDRDMTAERLLNEILLERYRAKEPTS